MLTIGKLDICRPAIVQPFANNVTGKTYDKQYRAFARLARPQ